MATIVSNIIVAVIALVGTMLTAQVKRQTDITNYRIDQLEKKMDKTEKLEDDIIVLKEQLKVSNHRIEDLEKGA